jgi:hypothetical protein
MHKQTLIGLAALALATPAMAEVRDLSGFTGVAASGRYDVDVTIGETYRVEITGADAERLKTEIDDGMLKIEPRNRNWFGGEPRINARVQITMPELEALAASRGVEMTATRIAASELSLAAAMGAELTASGTCTDLTAAAAMGGAIDASGLHCNTADVAASMGGDANVFATQTLDAAASMGGSVRVGGAPARTEIATSMGGDVDIR